MSKKHNDDCFERHDGPTRLAPGVNPNPNSSTRGPTGPTGPCCTGPTGPTGPCCTGATGSTEVADYAYITNQIDAQVIPANLLDTTVPSVADVNFNSSGANEFGIVSSDPPPLLSGARVLTVRKTATYEFGFQIRGRNVSGNFNPLMFELRVNGQQFGGGNVRFKSERPLVPNETLVLEGNGLIRLTDGDKVTLRNITNCVSFPTTCDSVALGDLPPANDIAVDASLYLVMIPPSIP